MKTHAEGVAESIGNIVDMHAAKRRGRMDIQDVGREAYIHWNGPVLSKADKLGTRTLDRLFGAERRNSLTNSNRVDSMVTKKLRSEANMVPFF